MITSVLFTVLFFFQPSNNLEIVNKEFLDIDFGFFCKPFTVGSCMQVCDLPITGKLFCSCIGNECSCQGTQIHNSHLKYNITTEKNVC